MDSGYLVSPGKEFSEQTQPTELSSPTELDSAPEQRLELNCVDHIQKTTTTTFKAARSSMNSAGVMQRDSHEAERKLTSRPISDPGSLRPRLCKDIGISIVVHIHHVQSRLAFFLELRVAEDPFQCTLQIIVLQVKQSKEQPLIHSLASCYHSLVSVQSKDHVSTALKTCKHLKPPPWKTVFNKHSAEACQIAKKPSHN